MLEMKGIFFWGRAENVGKKNRARQKWDEEICVENDG
jgi:hypothetical protein